MKYEHVQLLVARASLKLRVREISRPRHSVAESQAVAMAVGPMARAAERKVRAAAGIDLRPADSRHASQKAIESVCVRRLRRHRAKQWHQRQADSNARHQLVVGMGLQKIAPAKIWWLNLKGSRIGPVSDAGLAVTSRAVRQVKGLPSFDVVLVCAD